MHGLDIAQAIRCVLDAPRDVVHNEIFNVGSSEQNYRVREIAEIVGDEFPGCEVTFGDAGGRQPQLPGVVREDRQQAARLRVRVGRRSRARPSCTRCSAAIDMDEATFTGRGHTRLKQLEHLIRTGQVDAELFWSYAMIINTTPIEGVAVIDLELRSDDRGFFARTFCVEEFGAAGLQPVVEQCNLSFNHRAGTLRGMHFQIAPHPEAKLVRCIRGAIVDIIVDMRPDSPTRLQHVAVELTADNRRALYVPPFFAHGYQTLADDTEVMYQVSGSYEPAAERGLALRRPGAGPGWPLPVSVISAKDASWPLIADRDVRDYGWQPETAGARS